MSLENEVDSLPQNDAKLFLTDRSLAFGQPPFTLDIYFPVQFDL